MEQFKNFLTGLITIIVLTIALTFTFPGLGKIGSYFGLSIIPEETYEAYYANGIIIVASIIIIIALFSLIPKIGKFIRNINKRLPLENSNRYFHKSKNE